MRKEHNAAGARRPLVVTVSGSHSGCGKTRLIECLLPVLRSATAVKVCGEDASPARKYEEDAPEQHAGKDTGRYLAAGAERAVLLSGPPQETLGLARQIVREAATGVVVFETDSLAPELGPDLALFVAGEGEWKPGAERLRGGAHLVVGGIRKEGNRHE
ncbi:MAG: hypothetical protein ACYS8K_01905 [Planctomycetota bacterium]|jgi:hypothetical protein